MKNAIYILLLCTAIGYAQNTASAEDSNKVSDTVAANPPADIQLLTREDFKLANGRMLVIAVPCKLQNDETSSTILVSVVCQLKAFKELGIDKINDMIRFANEKVRLSLRLDHRYNPKEIKMAYIPDSNEWSLTNSFTEQDENGVVKERLLTLDFDTNGKFSVMKRIL